MNNLPIIKNLFSSVRMQKYLAKRLEGMDLKLFEAIRIDDCSKEWDWAHPSTYSAEGGCAYYCMLGTAIGSWVFVPSMVGIPFKIDNSWYTVVVTECSGTIAYHIQPLPNGDEAEDIAERFI